MTTPIQWLESLPLNFKYYLDDKDKIEELSNGFDFLDLITTHDYFSKNVLSGFLAKKSRVVMFGAGGTASWFLPKLLKIFNDAFTKRPDLAYPLEIIILDGDTVASKNIIRQNFIFQDIGENKAERLSERYNDLYPNITVTAIPMYATSKEYDEKVLELDTPLDPEHFFDLNGFLRSTDVVVNLVDNESFKRKLDFEIYKRRVLIYFNAGINLYNGQCYVSYPGLTNCYTFDHPGLINNTGEVEVHSCADADANGTDSNPEQMFNGNDLAASILANLFQSCITGTIMHRKIKFTTGANISIDKDLPTHSSLLFANSLNPTHPYEEAQQDLTDPKNVNLIKAVDTVIKIIEGLKSTVKEI